MTARRKSADQIRDRFLARVAEQLDTRVTRLQRLAAKRRGKPSVPPALASAIAGLSGFVRELRVIAEPDRPVPLSRRRLDLVAFLVRRAERDRPEAERRGIRVELTRAGSVVGRWDRDHLETMLGELLSNGTKYGAGHPVTLRLEVRKGSVDLIMRNGGEWTAPRGSIDRFRRGREDGVGFGVGLWILRRLAEAHGGRLHFLRRAGWTQTIVSLPCDTSRGDVSRFEVSFLSVSPHADRHPLPRRPRRPR